MAEAESLIADEKFDEANAKMTEVKELDDRWDAITEAQANARALNSEQRLMNVQELPGSTAAGEVTATVNLGLQAGATEEAKDLYASEAYKLAWAKKMMGAPLTAAEADAMKIVNDYTHTTENTSIVIPKTIAAGIWDMIEELFPLWNDVQKTYVKGAYTAMIGEDSTDAAWYDESTETEDGKETIGELALTGCELARAITVSWKLREMAVEDFIPYIQRKLARKMGAGLGYGVSHGKGKPAAGDTFKPEPLGIVTALEQEANTPQIVTYTAGTLTYKNLTAARAKVKAGANELKTYANATTIWGELANVTDENGKPIFVPDPVNTGVYRLFGMEVREDDSMADGEVLMSSPFVGYIANVNKEMSILAEEHIKKRKVDYCGYAIVDGGVTSTRAHALLKYAAASADAASDSTETDQTSGE